MRARNKPAEPQPDGDPPLRLRRFVAAEWEDAPPPPSTWDLPDGMWRRVLYCRARSEWTLGARRRGLIGPGDTIADYLAREDDR